MIQGSRGTPIGHIGVQEFIFIDFRVHWGSPLGVVLETFLRFVYDLDAKMGDCFQVYVFGDPGMEMMPECNGCMCYKHSKNNGFREISPFPLIPKNGVPREGFGSHFGVFGGPWRHFF